MHLRLLTLLVVVTAFLSSCAVRSTRPQKTSLTYEVVGAEASSADLASIRGILEERLESAGIVSEVTVAGGGIEVKYDEGSAGVTPQRLTPLICTPGKLTFYLCVDDALDRNISHKVSHKGKPMAVAVDASEAGSLQPSNAEFYKTEGLDGEPTVAFELGREEGEKLRTLTGNNVGKQLAICVDDNALCIATIQSAVPARGLLHNVDYQEIDPYGDLVHILQHGVLPYELKPSP